MLSSRLLIQLYKMHFFCAVNRNFYFFLKQEKDLLAFPFDKAAGMCDEKRKTLLEIEQDYQPPTVSKTSKQSEESKTSSSQKRGESQKHIDLFTKRGED